MEESARIKERSQIPQEDKWAIEDLYATDELWEQELATLAQDQEFLTLFNGKLEEDAKTLCAFLERTEQVNAKIELLANYCMRKSDEDTRNATYQAITGFWSFRTLLLTVLLQPAQQSPLCSSSWAGPLGQQ